MATLSVRTVTGVALLVSWLACIPPVVDYFWSVDESAVCNVPVDSACVARASRDGGHELTATPHAVYEGRQSLGQFDIVLNRATIKVEVDAFVDLQRLTAHSRGGGRAPPPGLADSVRAYVSFVAARCDLTMASADRASAQAMPPNKRLLLSGVR